MKLPRQGRMRAISSSSRRPRAGGHAPFGFVVHGLCGRQAVGAHHLHHLPKVDVTRLEVRRVGIGNVGRQHFHALPAKAQRAFVQSEVLVDEVHAGRS